MNKGWNTLLFMLCYEIEKYLSLHNVEGFKVLEVKQKYGMLVVYYTYYGYGNKYNELDILISEMEQKSKTICEFCGSEGVQISLNGWIYILCGSCKGKLGWQLKNKMLHL